MKAAGNEFLLTSPTNDLLHGPVYHIVGVCRQSLLKPSGHCVIGDLIRFHRSTLMRSPFIVDDMIGDRLFLRMLAWVLGVLVSCEWWQFNPQFWERLVGNSNNRPIYAIFVHASCAACDAIAPRFKEFAASIDLPRPAMFTAINCSTFPSICTEHGIQSYPGFSYIPKPEERHWEYPTYTDEAEWKKYITAKLSANVIDASSASPDDFFRTVEETLSGRTIFQMDITDDEQIMTSGYGRASVQLMNSSAKFLFKKLPEAVPRVVAHLGPECKVSTTNITDVTGFVAGRHFSHFFKYNFSTWSDVSRVQNLTVLFVQSKIHSEDMAMLRSLSRQFCGATQFGWAPIGFSFKILAQLIRGDQSTPFIGMVTPDGCKYLYRGKITEDAVVAWMTGVRNGKEVCAKGPVTDPQTAGVDGPVSARTWTQLAIGLLFAAFGATLFCLARRSRWAISRIPGSVNAFKYK
jgi:thiol-disulfide isomerase/thioredoxin